MLFGYTVIFCYRSLFLCRRSGG